ncbi:cytochrome P450 [Sistotremastrum niveocremeum HHB9708]|uniref:sterol 22-desaturase n=1 Tax=Sistotremastrum niveocremeum HHB9708 TaxID=1314777 RepID=A0A164SSU6_9AGAM|nr:cytochrome P450 [Sistotremastrum niveocremeum HHB9708]
MASLWKNSPSVPLSTPTSSTFQSAFIQPTSSSSTIFVTSLAVIASLLVLEQVVYRSKKASLPGDKWTIPIIGKFADSRSPTLQKYMKSWNSGALSAVSVFNIFIVMASSNEYTRKIFNSPTYAEPCLVASAKQILLPENWVFLTGKIHVDYRRVLNTLFTRKALAVYLQTMDTVSRRHYTQWLADAKKDPSPKQIMMTSRELNMETSLRVFCGKHIPDHIIPVITDRYWLITKALQLVNFPFAFPGTNVYNAIQARKLVMKWLEHAAAESKKHIAAGGDVECMLDAWVAELRSQESSLSSTTKRDFSDHEMAMVVLSFLFASQDAMSSGIIYLFQHFADFPDVLAKVREEQEKVRGGDVSKAMTLEMLDDMPYMKAAIKESLRIKPPVTMVPYKTTRAFPISDSYVVPANSIVIPSVYPSLHDPEVYPSPSSYTPSRWLDPQSTANTTPKNYLVFGSGPHKCIGVEYAMMHMACAMGIASVMMDWEHVRTEDSDDTEIIAALFPKDGCYLKVTPRQ